MFSSFYKTNEQKSILNYLQVSYNATNPFSVVPAVHVSQGHAITVSLEYNAKHLIIMFSELWR